MTPRILGLALAVLFGTVTLARPQQPLPRVDDVDLPKLREHCRRLLATLERLKAPLPAETERDLRRLLEAADGEEPAEMADRVQELLDPHCLIGVTINPESRVKGARGPAPAVLHQGRDAYILLKLHNDAGVTQALAVTGLELRQEGRKGAGRWLEAAVFPAASEKGLTGARLEYLILRLRALEPGKREATLQFDVGQGTQDLGFRAEVPVLFLVRPAER